jgi:hypothetical protein
MYFLRIVLNYDMELVRQIPRGYGNIWQIIP